MQGIKPGEPRVILERSDDRPYVRIHGKAYFYIGPMDLSLIQEVRFNRLQQQVNEQIEEQAASGATDETIALELGRRLSELVAMVLPDLPADLLREPTPEDRALPEDAWPISDRWKMALLQGFSGAVETPAPLLRIQEAAKRRAKTDKGASGNRPRGVIKSPD